MCYSCEMLPFSCKCLDLFQVLQSKGVDGVSRQMWPTTCRFNPYPSYLIILGWVGWLLCLESDKSLIEEVVTATLKQTAMRLLLKKPALDSNSFPIIDKSLASPFGPRCLSRWWQLNSRLGVPRLWSCELYSSGLQCVCVQQQEQKLAQSFQYSYWFLTVFSLLFSFLIFLDQQF